MPGSANLVDDQALVAEVGHQLEPVAAALLQRHRRRERGNHLAVGYPARGVPLWIVVVILWRGGPTAAEPTDDRDGHDDLRGDVGAASQETAPGAQTRT